MTGLSDQQRPLLQRRLAAFWRSPASRAGLVVSLVILLQAVVPVGWLPHSPTGLNLSLANRPGVWGGEWVYPLGTDFLGRDMLSRVVYATRLTLIVSGGAAAIASAFGIIVGMVAGFYGGWIDELISWLIDVQLAFPVLALAVSIIAMMGGSLSSLVIVLATTSWATMARVVRAQTLAARNEVYVDAALAVGVPVRRVVFRHILPNILSSVLVVATFEMARLVLTESALSFLGLGVAPPQVTWGGMVGDARYYVYDAWWTAAVPGTMITALVIAFSFVSDGLRDALDPRSWVSER